MADQLNPLYPMILLHRSKAMEMYRLVRDYPDIETSWGVAGIAFPGVDSFALITNIILPTNGEISRTYSQTKIGGAHMASAVSWLESMFPVIKPRMGSGMKRYEDSEFVFFSKGHSHHTLGLRQQSSTDEQSTRESVTIDGLTMAIAPLANIVSDPNPYIGINHPEKCVSISQHTKVQLRFYFYNKTMAVAKKMKPLLVTPILIEDSEAPQLPINAWHLTQPEMYLAQMAQLKAYGCSAKTVNKPNGAGTGLDMNIMIGHQSWSGMVTIGMTETYPRVKPVITVFDLGKPKGTRVCFHENSLYLRTGDVWAYGDTLLDIVMKHEARGLL